MIRTNLLKTYGLTPQAIVRLTGGKKENMELVQQTLRRYNHNAKLLKKMHYIKLPEIISNVYSGKRLIFNELNKTVKHAEDPGVLVNGKATKYFVEYVNNMIADAKTRLEKFAPKRKAIVKEEYAIKDMLNKMMGIDKTSVNPKTKYI